MKMEINGAADADRALAAMTEGELRLASVIEEGIKKIRETSLQARLERYIDLIPERYKCQTEEGRDMLANHTAALIRDAVPLIENCDSRGIDRRLGEFERSAIVAAAMTAPQPALMPDMATFRHFGWSSQDAPGSASCASNRNVRRRERQWRSCRRNRR